MQDLQSLINPLLDICSQAGAAICELYAAPEAGHYQSKGDDSPLTQADLAAHEILTTGLGQLQPALPVLSEESSEQNVADRKRWPRFWMVDPLDGTKEFLGRTGEFTINIALIDAHTPMLGLIYLPLEQVAYVGVPNEGAQRLERRGEGWISSASKTSTVSMDRPLRVLASRRHRGPRLEQCLAWVERRWGEFERFNSGSALKFCQLAAGEGDFYPRYARCCEWDTAAGHALVTAAGGQVLGLDGEPLRYNTRDSLYSEPFYALADPTNPIWVELLALDAGDGSAS